MERVRAECTLRPATHDVFTLFSSTVRSRGTDLLFSWCGERKLRTISKIGTKSTTLRKKTDKPQKEPNQKTSIQTEVDEPSTFVFLSTEQFWSSLHHRRRMIPLLLIPSSTRAPSDLPEKRYKNPASSALSPTPATHQVTRPGPQLPNVTR